MADIKVLSPETASLIAAGEVVERPASVIKELVENSVDAGAGRIVVEIKNGGISYMRVTDNGCGIQKEQVPTAFLRHATSKISDGNDLEKIQTLGFRGEALYSICAVSEVEIFTCTSDETEGTYASLTGGEVRDIRPAGCPKGTTITVRNLFYNTPARMKFLKKDSTEAAHIEDTLKRMAMARPDISIRFISNGKEVFYTSGDNSLKNVVYSVLGAETASQMIEADYEENGVRVTGLVGKASLSRGNRANQIFFVNRRLVVNKNFYLALSESYKSHMMSGRFPVAILNIAVNPALCDVNVHPTKAEIKFSNEKDIFSAVYWAAKNALYNADVTRDMKIEDKQISKKPSGFENIKKSGFIMKPPKTEHIPDDYIPPKPLPKTGFAQHNVIREDAFIPKPQIPQDVIQKAFNKERHSENESMPETKEDVRILGQLFGTYIVAEYDSNLILIDQHAAHERIIYEEIIKNEKVNSQILLLPLTVQVTASEFAAFEENKEFFDKSGFDAEEFGHNTVKISAIPDNIDIAEAQPYISEALEILANGREPAAARADKAIYTLACKAALKAGQKLSAEEQKKLCERILMTEGEATCPHGRPVIMKLSKYKIEKQFKRIV